MCQDSIYPAQAIKFHFDCMKQRLGKESTESTKSQFGKLLLERLRNRPVQTVTGAFVLGVLGTASLVPLVPLIAPGIAPNIAAPAAQIIAAWVGGIGSNVLASWLDDAGQELMNKNISEEDRLNILVKYSAMLEEKIEQNNNIKNELVQHLRKSGVLDIAKEELDELKKEKEES